MKNYMGLWIANDFHHITYFYLIYTLVAPNLENTDLEFLN